MRARAWLRRLRDPVLVADAHTGELRDCNPAAETLFGYPARQMVGRPIGELVPELIASGETDGYAARELRARHVTGSELPIEVSLSRVNGELLAVLRDLRPRLRVDEHALA